MWLWSQPLARVLGLTRWWCSVKRSFKQHSRMGCLFVCLFACFVLYFASLCCAVLGWLMLVVLFCCVFVLLCFALFVWLVGIGVLPIMRTGCHVYAEVTFKMFSRSLAFYLATLASLAAPIMSQTNVKTLSDPSSNPRGKKAGCMRCQTYLTHLL